MRASDPFVGSLAFLAGETRSTPVQSRTFCTVSRVRLCAEKRGRERFFVVNLRDIPRESGVVIGLWAILRTDDLTARTPGAHFVEGLSESPVRGRDLTRIVTAFGRKIRCVYRVTSTGEPLSGPHACVVGDDPPRKLPSLPMPLRHATKYDTIFDSETKPKKPKKPARVPVVDVPVGSGVAPTTNPAETTESAPEGEAGGSAEEGRARASEVTAGASGETDHAAAFRTVAEGLSDEDLRTALSENRVTIPVDASREVLLDLVVETMLAVLEETKGG